MNIIRSIDLNNAVVIVDFSEMERSRAVSLTPETINVPESVFATTTKLRELYSKFVLSKFSYLIPKPQAVAIPQTRYFL